jgi:hypothetical protein
MVRSLLFYKGIWLRDTQRGGTSPACRNRGSVARYDVAHAALYAWYCLSIFLST